MLVKNDHKISYCFLRYVSRSDSSYKIFRAWLLASEKYLNNNTYILFLPIFVQYFLAAIAARILSFPSYNVNLNQTQKSLRTPHTVHLIWRDVVKPLIIVLLLCGTIMIVLLWMYIKKCLDWGICDFM